MVKFKGIQWFDEKCLGSGGRETAQRNFSKPLKKFFLISNGKRQVKESVLPVFF